MTSKQLDHDLRDRKNCIFMRFDAFEISHHFSGDYTNKAMKGKYPVVSLVAKKRFFYLH